MSSKSTLYFSYGSNLDFEDWTKWCNEREEDPSGLVELESAFLPEYRLKFHYYSGSRKGGAADIVEANPANIVPGALFELDEYTLGLMDRKEGVKSKSYQRKQVHVITLDGRIVEALTYVVCQERIQNRFIEPTDDYVGLIRNGLEVRGLPTIFLEAAIGSKEYSDELSEIFVYGTLMRGESRHSLIANRDIKFLELASTKGRLLHISDFPGMKYDTNSNVSGELYRGKEISQILTELDRIEGFHGYQFEDSLFNRMICKIDVKGGFFWAWTYLFNGESENEISSGNWRQRS
jgi:gamma-glutamylcyclotransferase (GGCT)/AIG2-like uncharacterized protein YtfP